MPEPARAALESRIAHRCPALTPDARLSTFAFRAKWVVPFLRRYSSSMPSKCGKANRRPLGLTRGSTLPSSFLVDVIYEALRKHLFEGVEANMLQSQPLPLKAPRLVAVDNTHTQQCKEEPESPIVHFDCLLDAFRPERVAVEDINRRKVVPVDGVHMGLFQIIYFPCDNTILLIVLPGHPLPRGSREAGPAGVDQAHWLHIHVRARVDRVSPKHVHFHVHGIPPSMHCFL